MTRGSASIEVRRLSRSEAGTLAVLAIAVALSRLPFLGAGHGVDFDAWRLAGAARTIAATHSYSASRLPGYPLPECVGALLHGGGALALNAATATLSLFAVLLFALSVRALGSRDFAAAGLALAFTPIVFINSTNSMDYVWALAFLMGSLYFAVEGRPLAAGLMLGGAVACRITSGAMLVPLAIVLAARDDRGRFSRLILFGAATSVVAVLAFLPVVLTYGSGFLWFLDVGRLSLPESARAATEGVWGRVGLLGVLIAAAMHLLRRRSGAAGAPASIPSGPSGETIAWALAIALYTAAFVRLPVEAGYLIPIVPFAILLMGRFLARGAFLVACAALVASSLLGIGKTGARAGPVFADHRARVERMVFVEHVLREGDSIPGRSVIVVGGWLPQVQEMLLDSGRAYGAVDVRYAAVRPQPSWGQPFARVTDGERTALYVHAVDEADLDDFRKMGYEIRYTPGQRPSTEPSHGLALDPESVARIATD